MRSGKTLYSDLDNLSAQVSCVAGIARPSTVAVLRLIARSNLVGCSIGRSEGLDTFQNTIDLSEPLGVAHSADRWRNVGVDYIYGAGK
jgi:hypothetical protein